MYKIYTKPFGVPNRHVHKFLLIMRLTTLLLVATIMQVSASGFAQRISLSEKSVPLEKVFKEIRRQSGYDFVFDRKLLLKAKPVNVNLKNATLEDALNSCFANQPFIYSLDEKTVIVKEKETGIIEKIKRFFTTITVSGTVIDENGKILPGITVAIKGISGNTVTNNLGHFMLADVDEDAVLIFSAVGREKVEIKVEGRTSITVTVKTKASDLQEVTVSTGYQILKKSNMVGATSSVKMSELYNNGISSIEQMLQGKLTGVNITNTSGMVGTRQTVRVRGTSTLSGSAEPIWVVDGIIQEDPLPFKAQELNTLGGITPDNTDFIRNFVGNSIAWLNPNDIEDITVLKDAAATAIYGIRAANGVIVINTKRGKTGPVSINYSTSMSTNERVTYDKLNLMNSKERVSLSREIYNRGLVSNNVKNNIGYAGALNDYLYNKTINGEEFNTRVSALETVNMDWFDILFRTPLSMNHNLSVSGGSNNTSYYSSFGYNNTKGTAIGNDSKGFTGNMSVTSQVTKKFNLSARLSASQKTTDGFYKNDPYNYSSKINRALGAYNADGSLFYYPTGLSNLKYNILNELANTGNSNKVLSANAAIDANYEIIEGLKLQSLFSYNATATVGESYATEQTEYVAREYRYYDYGLYKSTDAAYKASKMPIGGEYNLDQNNSNTWSWRNSISYSKVFNQKHVMALMFGQEMNSTRYTGYTNTTLGYLRDRGKSFATLPLTTLSYGYTNVNDFTTKFVPKITDTRTNTTGLYFTSSYTFDNRYVANLSVRNDRSNRFGQFTNENFNPVYAGGLRWNMANEKWFQSSYWLSNLSLSGSFGYQRNISTSISPDLIIKTPGAGSTNTNVVVDQNTGETLLTISSLPYGDLRWEQNSSLNLALDFSLFNSKVQGAFSYYSKKGKDLITSLNVPREYGVTSMLVNGGSMNNSGYEISANFVPVRTRNFNWSVSINTSKNTNKIIETGAQLATWRTAVGGALNKAGDPVSGFYAFKFDGVDAATGYPKIDLSVNEGKNPATDPTAYLQYMGKLDPDFTSGLGMNFRYKMLSLNSSFYLQVGGKKFLTPLYDATQNLPTEYENTSRNLLDRWTPTNTTSSVPGLPDNTIPYLVLPGGNANNTITRYEAYNNSTDRVVSASSLRCQNINVAYSLSNDITRKLRCKSISIGAGVSNPFWINSKDFEGLDPEVATGGQPRTRAYSLNLNISL
ncbi:SusC/RagA family TonB-linked outer membrane protein [Pedobacter sp. AW31-3R]|uniref:SusC/RagA family TonB-linked outer membrane protein n=1 Tax=Pedobacter sp. AW31-3R TaxID=3445781 RepID=UPI003FA0A7CF